MAPIRGESARRFSPVKDTSPQALYRGLKPTVFLRKHWRKPEYRFLRLGNSVPITEKDKLLRSGKGRLPYFRAYGPAKPGDTPSPFPSLTAPPGAPVASQKVPCGTFKAIKGLRA